MQFTSSYVPKVALRFDYEATVAGYTPKWSIYITDIAAAYPAGLPQGDLTQTPGTYLGDHKVFSSVNKKKSFKK